MENWKRKFDCTFLNKAENLATYAGLSTPKYSTNPDILSNNLICQYIFACSYVVKSKLFSEKKHNTFELNGSFLGTFSPL